MHLVQNSLNALKWLKRTKWFRLLTFLQGAKKNGKRNRLNLDERTVCCWPVPIIWYQIWADGCWRRTKERIARTLEQISFIQNEVRCSRLQNSVLKRIGIAPEVVIKCDPPIYYHFVTYFSAFIITFCITRKLEMFENFS